MAAQVNHPNVCVIHESHLDYEPPFLVLEYVSGETLRELMRGPVPLTIDEAVRIARDVAGGCHACHKKGIVHRDLKPENIKRSTDGWLKILDFGLARPFDSQTHPVTSDGNIIGTIDYLSPEQTRAGLVPIGAASDQFTLGVILYELLTGQRPFSVKNDPTKMATLLRIRDCKPQPPRELRPDLDEALQSIMLRMLECRPGDRFKSMSDVVEVLDSYRAGNRDIVPTGRSRRWFRLSVAGCLVAALMVVAAGIGRYFSPATLDPRVLHKPVASAELLTLIRDDLDSQVKSEQQPFQRYFSLAHLAGDPAIGTSILQRYRDALIQLLHLLAVAQPTTPQPIDAEQLVLRVDIKALGWNAEAFRHTSGRSSTCDLALTVCFASNSRSAAACWFVESTGWLPQDDGLTQPQPACQLLKRRGEVLVRLPPLTCDGLAAEQGVKPERVA
jgi:hypothetical protein